MAQQTKTNILSLLSLLLLIRALPVHANKLDGFVANCTSNQDGTGLCVNQETKQSFTCLIIPGQVIDCSTASGKDFQCVAISGAIGNQAQFSCDPKVDQMLMGELTDKAFNPEELGEPVDANEASTTEIIDGNLTEQQRNLLDYLRLSSTENQANQSPQ